MAYVTKTPLDDAHGGERRAQENQAQRRERKSFFRDWVAASLIGAVLIAAIAAYALASHGGERAAALVVIGLMIAAVFSAAIWLLRFIAKGRKGQRLLK